MKPYKVNIHSDYPTGIYDESFHVQAGSAKAALDKAYRKFDKRCPGSKDMAVHKLELVEEHY